MTQRSVRFSFFSQSRFSSYRCRLVRGVERRPVARLLDRHRRRRRARRRHLRLRGRRYRRARGHRPHAGIESLRRGDLRRATGQRDVRAKRPADVHDATFGFSSPVPGATFECQLVAWGERDRWQPCDPDTGATYTVSGDGLWNFEVRGIDPVSGDESDPPRDPTADRRRYGADILGVESATDDDEQRRCRVRLHAAGVGERRPELLRRRRRHVRLLGQHLRRTQPAPGLPHLSLQARDLLGTTRTTNVTWTIDRTPPTVVLVTKPKAFVTSTFATFGFSSDEEPGHVRVPCRCLRGDALLTLLDARTFRRTAPTASPCVPWIRPDNVHCPQPGTGRSTWFDRSSR